MSEVNQRVANFIKAFSMFMVIGSLLYMYAYSPASSYFMNSSQDWMLKLSREHIFYVGLGVFAIFNLLMNIAISMYKNSKGTEPQSVLFRSKEQKQKVLVWLNWFLAGINILITCIVLFLALIKINEVTDTAKYLFIPVAGLIILVFIIFGLIRAVSIK
jgi:hypothetical protein